jgi:Holliday junction DNA helicase RuvA
VIGRLRGLLVHKQPPFLLVDCNGVGYELEAPMSTFYGLPPAGEPITLLTHLLVREDAQVLYGFASEAERVLFRSLLKVSGVGARMALAILSGMDVQEFRRCVHGGDAAALTRLPGIGRKTAERLIVEMRDRLEAPATLASGAAATAAAPDDPVAEAVSALIALGYKPADASRMVRGVGSDGLASEEIIRVALKSTAAR